MNTLNQKGVGTVAVLLILFIVGAAGFTAWKVWGSKTGNAGTKQNSLQSADITENTGTQDSEPKKVATGITITTGNSEFGTMLFNDKNQAIYIWEREKSTQAECYGDCAAEWPPVLTDGSPHAAGDVRNDLLGTTKRTDGSTQVTYNGHPLYYYAHEGAGEVKCHKVRSYGGLWWVIQPSGVRAN